MDCPYIFSSIALDLYNGGLAIKYLYSNIFDWNVTINLTSSIDIKTIFLYYSPLFNINCTVSLNTYAFSIINTHLLYSYPGFLDIYSILDLNHPDINIGTDLIYRYPNILDLNCTTNLNLYNLNASINFAFSILKVLNINSNLNLNLNTHDWFIGVHLNFEY